MHQVDDGHLRRRQHTDGRAPGAGAAAQVEESAVQSGELAGLLGIKKPGEQIEGHYLALVGMAGKLEIKKAQAVGINIGPVLEQGCEISLGLSQQKIVLRLRVPCAQ